MCVKEPLILWGYTLIVNVSFYVVNHVLPKNKVTSIVLHDRFAGEFVLLLDMMIKDFCKLTRFYPPCV